MIYKELEHAEMQDDTENEKPEEVVMLPDMGDVFTHNKTIEKINSDFVEMFSDLTTAVNIIKSIVLNGHPILELSKNIPPTIAMELGMEIQDVIENKYGLIKQLPDIIDSCLKTVGSEAYIHIPNTALKGLLSKQEIESVEESNGYDNIFRDEPLDKVSSKIPGILTISKDLSYLANIVGVENKVQGDVFPDMVSESDVNLDYLLNIPDNILKEEQVSLEVVNDIETMDGITINVDTTNVVPIRLKNKGGVVFYLVALDEYGVGISSDAERYMNAETEVVTTDATTSELRDAINSVRDRVKKSDVPNPEKEITIESYISLINIKLREVLDSKNVNNLIATPDLGTMSNILFRRALEKKGTNLMVIPADYLTYYHFNQRENGTGETLIEPLYHTLSMRAALTFAKVRSEIENSIPRKRVEVTIDPTNQNPKPYMTSFVNEYMKKSKSQFKWNATSIEETADMIQGLNTSFSFKHPKVAYNEITEDSSNSSNINISTDLLDSFKKDIYRSMGITQTMIDDASSDQYVTIRLLNNELVMKSMSGHQITLMEHFTHHVIGVLNQDGGFNTYLKNVIDENYKEIMKYLGDKIINAMDNKNMSEEVRKEWIHKHIIGRVKYSLPTLRNEDESVLADRYVAYVDQIDDTIEHILIGTEALPEDLITEEVGILLDTFKQSYKSTLIRRWMVENNYMPEVADIITTVDGVASIEHLSKNVADITSLIKALNRYGLDLRGLLKVGKRMKLDIDRVLPETNAKKPKDNPPGETKDNPPKKPKDDVPDETKDNPGIDEI